ncbi:hypothetical protein AAULR_25056, partial [Lacticaseibacillus rhamnosus MTCC 5462]
QIDRIVSTISKSMVPLSNVFIIDSESTDNTLVLLQRYKVEHQVMLRRDFSHGFVRHEAVNHFRDKVDYLLMLTQDVVLRPSQLIDLFWEF